MSSISHIPLRSMYSDALAIEHEQSGHNHGDQGKDPNEDKCVLNTHTGDPEGKCEPDDHCKDIANEYHGDQSVIEDLDLSTQLLMLIQNLGELTRG